MAKSFTKIFNLGGIGRDFADGGGVKRQGKQVFGGVA